MCPRIRICTLFFSLLLGCQQLNAQIILDFTRTSSGGVRVTGSGTGRTTNFGYNTVWTILDFDDDFLSDSLGTDAIFADSVSGTLSNSWGFTRDVTDFAVGRSDTSGDDLAFITDRNMFFWINQPYFFEIDAIFDRSTLDFDDLIPGTYTDTSPSGGTEIFGVTTVNVVSAVPEPATTGLLISGAGILCLAVTRRRLKKRTLKGKAADEPPTPPQTC